MLTLKASLRDKKENIQQLHSKGLMPAVFYGKKTPSTPISVAKKEFIKMWKEAGESSVVSLDTPNGQVLALIHDIDIDPVTDFPRHADFYVFEKDHKISVEVPLEFIGISPAVKDLGGILVKVLYDIEIEALPTNLPHSVKVDLSFLSTLGSHILAKDLKLPEGVSLSINPDDVVVSASEPKEEETEETPIDLSDIEVEKKGKEESTEEGGDAPSGQGQEKK
ncbi:MAG: 50S ribosomal protein L25 [Candidatus Pacebacteria bacterium]|nr:50S ribosomal protein L25 [Candidatus Paceibacterota bacterium]